MINLVQLFPYLIGFDPTNPTDNSIVSQFPSNERDSRSALVSAWAIEHDNVDGRHSFGIGNTAARDAITTWTSGAIYINTSAGAGNTVLQTVVSVTASVPGWEDTGRFTSADVVKLSTIDVSAQANVSIATSAEAVAGTDNVNTMTSLRTKTAIDVAVSSAIDAIVDTNMEVFTADGTWTQPTGITSVLVWVIGSGGGGGGGSLGNDSGGGGGGEVVHKLAVVAGNITIQVGVGGNGGSEGTGSTGETSFFGDIVANGGLGGINAGAGGIGGNGGADGSGHTFIRRIHGTSGGASGGGDSGSGGVPRYGSDTLGTQEDTTNPSGPGDLGIARGQGGSGGGSLSLGGKGADGLVIVWW